MEYEFLKVLILLGGGILAGWFGHKVWAKKQERKKGALL